MLPACHALMPAPTATAAPRWPRERCGGPGTDKTGRPVCKDCRVDNRSQPYPRDVQLKSLYGIAQADYDRLLALQYGRCAICETTKPGTGAPGELTTTTKPPSTRPPVRPLQPRHWLYARRPGHPHSRRPLRDEAPSEERLTRQPQITGSRPASPAAVRWRAANSLPDSSRDSNIA